MLFSSTKPPLPRWMPLMVVLILSTSFWVEQVATTSIQTDNTVVGQPGILLSGIRQQLDVRFGATGPECGIVFGKRGEKPPQAGLPDNYFEIRANMAMDVYGVAGYTHFFLCETIGESLIQATPYPLDFSPFALDKKWQSKESRVTSPPALTVIVDPPQPSTNAVANFYINIRSDLVPSISVLRTAGLQFDFALYQNSNCTGVVELVRSDASISAVNDTTLQFLGITPGAPGLFSLCFKLSYSGSPDHGRFVPFAALIGHSNQNLWIGTPIAVDLSLSWSVSSVHPSSTHSLRRLMFDQVLTIAIPATIRASGWMFLAFDGTRGVCSDAMESHFEVAASVAPLNGTHDVLSDVSIPHPESGVGRNTVVLCGALNSAGPWELLSESTAIFHKCEPHEIADGHANGNCTTCLPYDKPCNHLGTCGSEDSYGNSVIGPKCRCNDAFGEFCQFKNLLPPVFSPTNEELSTEQDALISITAREPDQTVLLTVDYLNGTSYNLNCTAQCQVTIYRRIKVYFSAIANHPNGSWSLAANTITYLLLPTQSVSPSRSLSVPKTDSASIVATDTVTQAVTVSRSETVTPPPTETPSASPSVSVPPTDTPSKSATITPPPTGTPTDSETHTPPPTATGSLTLTRQETPTASSSHTMRFVPLFSRTETKALTASPTLLEMMDRMNRSTSKNIRSRTKSRSTMILPAKFKRPIPCDPKTNADCAAKLRRLDAIYAAPAEIGAHRPAAPSAINEMISTAGNRVRQAVDVVLGYFTDPFVSEEGPTVASILRMCSLVLFFLLFLVRP